MKCTSSYGNQYISLMSKVRLQRMNQFYPIIFFKHDLKFIGSCVTMFNTINNFIKKKKFLFNFIFPKVQNKLTFTSVKSFLQ